MKSNTPPRWWDLPAAALLVVALLTAATRLVVTNWTQDLSITQTIVFLAVITGLALGQSRFSARLATFIALAYGTFIVPWMVGRTMRAGIPWPERLASLSGRLNIIINQLINQEVVQDSLLFIVLMAILFWVLGVHAGYTLTRHGNAWRAILPAGLSLFVIHSFDAVITRRAWYLAVYLFFALVMVARVSFLHQQERWQKSRTALPPHLGLDFIRFTLLATAIIVLFSWTAPALADTLPPAEKVFLRIKQPWDRARDRFNNAFASLRSSVGVVSDFYGSNLMLGRGNRLTDIQVFSAHLSNPLPAGVRLYWQARTYDTYINGGWRSSIRQSQPFGPNDLPLRALSTQGRWLGTFEIVAANPISTLYTPPQPLWVSRPSQAEMVENPDGTMDVSTFMADPTLRPGEVYQVQASLTDATVAQLEAAGSDYPKWVTDRYLQLPNTITQRTRNLAHDITQGAATPYDKAVAITNYLRNNITYSDTVPNQPDNVDSVDWFLFDLRKGFCNYYSTAEVVMLRSLGIPARWAVGFAQGDRLDDGTYVVRQRDAHAWPEVFFPGIGWVEFEPTASQPSIVRLQGNANALDNQSADLSAADQEELQRRQLEEELRLLRERNRANLGTLPASKPGWLLALYWAGPLTLALGILGFLAYRRRDHLNIQVVPIVMEASLVRIGVRPPKRLSLWAQRAALPPLARAYLEINNALSRLGRQPGLTETPFERATALAEVLPDAKGAAQKLVREYQLATFSSHYIADLPAARFASKEIRSLSYKAWIKRLFARVQRPRRDMPVWPRR